MAANLGWVVVVPGIVMGAPCADSGAMRAAHSQWCGSDVAVMTMNVVDEKKAAEDRRCSVATTPSLLISSSA